MKTTARAATLVAAVLLAIGLAGCTDSGDEPAPLPTTPVVQLGAPGEANRTLSPEEAAQLTTPPHTEADVAFVRDMLHHHSQAIEMVGMVEERTDDESVRLLAERMGISQEDEIVQLETWLQKRGEAPRDPDGHAHTAETMPGLLTDEQMDQLAAASGAAFDRLFLEFMIHHHTGAVQMVTDLYAADGGNEPEIDTFAKHVESDQNIEIARMQQMLAERS